MAPERNGCAAAIILMCPYIELTGCLGGLERAIEDGQVLGLIPGAPRCAGGVDIADDAVHLVAE